MLNATNVQCQALNVCPGPLRNPGVKLLVTGSSGLIGSEVVTYFAKLCETVYGVDNNMRADFFGPQGDTSWNTKRLQNEFRDFEHHSVDIRNRAEISALVARIRPDAIVHTAA